MKGLIWLKSFVDIVCGGMIGIASLIYLIAGNPLRNGFLNAADYLGGSVSAPWQFLEAAAGLLLAGCGVAAFLQTKRSPWNWRNLAVGGLVAFLLGIYLVLPLPVLIIQLAYLIYTIVCYFKNREKKIKIKPIG